MLKKILFNLLPKKTQRELILFKTGFQLIQNGKFTDTIFSDFFIVKKDTLWKNRLTKELHEPEISSFYERHLKNDDIVFDIGANQGFFPTLISKINPDVPVYAFEGLWYVFYYLNLNKSINDPKDKWKLIQAFVGTNNSAKKTEISLDNFCHSHKVYPTILQMDVDGREWDVLMGAKELVNKRTTEFIIEIHPADLQKLNVNHSAISDFFIKCGYDILYLSDFRTQQGQWSTKLNRQSENDEYYLYAFIPNKSRIKIE